jgi:hypothetical protein
MSMTTTLFVRTFAQNSLKYTKFKKSNQIKHFYTNFID